MKSWEAGPPLSEIQWVACGEGTEQGLWHPTVCASLGNISEGSAPCQAPCQALGMQRCRVLALNRLDPLGVTEKADINQPRMVRVISPPRKRPHVFAGHIYSSTRSAWLVVAGSQAGLAESVGAGEQVDVSPGGEWGTPSWEPSLPSNGGSHVLPLGSQPRGILALGWSQGSSSPLRCWDSKFLAPPRLGGITHAIWLWLSYSPPASAATGQIRAPAAGMCHRGSVQAVKTWGCEPSLPPSLPHPSHLILMSILSAGSRRPRVPSPSPTPVSKRRKAHLRRLDRRWTLGGMVNRQHSRGDDGGQLLLTESCCLSFFH